MCQTPNYISLSETENAQINWCKGCQHYSVIFNNCCFSFADQELATFQQVLRQLKTVDYHYAFKNDHYAIIKRNRSNMGITLNKDQTRDFIALIEEALAMKEIFLELFINDIRPSQ